MQAEFWHKRWAEGRTGFHLDEVNPMLLEYFDRLAADTASSIFVPLSGKSVDLSWLAQRVATVIGNELSEQAVRQFFSHVGVEPQRQPGSQLEWWHSANINIACGDFFQLTAEDLAAVDLAYDRAALIALPGDMRLNYAAHMTNLLGPNSRMLLITLEYDQTKMEGPPFAVDEAEVHALYADNFDIELLGSQDVMEARFRDRGLSAMQEKAYILRRRDNA